MKNLWKNSSPINTKQIYLNEDCEEEPEDPKAIAKFVLHTYTMLGLFKESEYKALIEFIDGIDMNQNTGPEGVPKAPPLNVVVDFLGKNYEPKVIQKLVRDVREVWIIHAEYPEDDHFLYTFPGVFYTEIAYNYR